VRIVQLANLYSPVSGGLRTAVDALGRGYAAAGHERVLVVPGRAFSWRDDATGTVVTVPGPSIAPGYRLVLDPRPVLRVLGRLRPDVIEVSDKATLTVAARWARRRGVRSVLLSHERLDAILAPRVPAWVPLEPAVDSWNRRLVRAFDAIVVTSRFAAAEFERIGAGPPDRVPLGVDLATFRPVREGRAWEERAWDERAWEEHARDERARGEHARDERARAERGWGGGAPAPGAARPVRLVHLSRLSAEKRPGLALDTMRALRRWNVPVRLDVVGEGPLRPRLERLAARERLPVAFHGHVATRGGVARLLGGADVALATCPVESFGLAVLEALACGTPVVAVDRGAAGELLGPGAGVSVPSTGEGLAAGVTDVVSWPAPWRRAAARSRAERYPWTATVAAMLAVHRRDVKGAGPAPDPRELDGSAWGGAGR
jgi:alpha-1,6-mannosyltransferase